MWTIPSATASSSPRATPTCCWRRARSVAALRRLIHVSRDEVCGETGAAAFMGKREASQLLSTNPNSADGRSYGLPIIRSRGDIVTGPNQSTEKLSKFIVGTLRQTCDEEPLTEAVDALDLLVQHGSYVCASTFYDILKRCTALRDLPLGTRVHALAVESGYEANAFLANHIICMYASHGRLAEAAQAFARVAVPSRYMWASIIFAYARHGQPKEAIELYRQMQESGMKPDNHIFAAVLKACASGQDLSSGKEVHADLFRTARQPDMHVYTCLVDMYAKCGSLEDARRVFDNVPSKNVVTWTAMIAGYVQHGLGQEALSLYVDMQHEGVTPCNVVTFKCLLKACASVGALLHGKQLHAQIQQRSLESDVVVGTCLLNMYAKCGSLEDARKVFDNLPSKDVVTWNAMISGYVQHGLGQEALTLYESMQQEGIIPADAATFVCLLQACAIMRALNEGKQFHAQILANELETDVVIGTCLVDMYVKCGSFEDARRVFDNLPCKTVVTWTAMVAGYAQHGRGEDALICYASMQREGITFANPVTFVSLLQACSTVAALEKGKEIHAEIGMEVKDLYVASTLIDMYGKCGSMIDAQQVFCSLSTRDVVTWNAFIAGYARQGGGEQVFCFLDRMLLDGIQPSGSTFVSVLTACSHLGLVEKGQKYFEAMQRDYGITPSIEHYNCMVDLLGRAGLVDKAMEMVKMMPYEPDIEMWKCMLGACQKWNKVDLARHAFECAVRLDKDDAAAYVLMSNIFASAHMHIEAKEIQAMRVRAQAWKRLGQSWWTDSDGIVHIFAVEDEEHPKTHEIYVKLKRLFTKLKETGYMLQLDSVLNNNPVDEKEAAWHGHSARLSMALAFLKAG